MKNLVAVPLTIPAETGSPLGIVDDIRLAVQFAKKRYPALASSPLQDVVLKRWGSEVKLTLYFAPQTPS